MVKEFRYIVSNYAGFLSNENLLNTEAFDSKCTKKSTVTDCYGRGREVTETIKPPIYLQNALDELRAAQKIKEECNKFIEKCIVRDIKINHYTPMRHNNGGQDTIIEVVTILY